MCICEASITHFPCVLKSVIITVESLTWLLVMYFAPPPKYIIWLLVEYWQDSKIPIWIWKSLIEDTHNLYIN